jgi:predicted component of type VI protein secretion system
MSPLTANLISEEIKDVLANYEPRATVLDVIVATNQQLNGYNVTVVFTVAGGISTPIEVSTFLQRLR